MKNARSFLLTGLAVIAAVVVLGVWKGYIPPKAGTEGAIGAAQRYSSTQITDADVQLSDPSVQAFLQSDVFHAIATNPDFRKVVTKDAFKKAAQVEGMLDVVALDLGHGGKDYGKSVGKDFNQLVASEDFQNLAASEDFNKAIKDSKVQALLASEDFQAIVASEDFGKYIEQLRNKPGKDAAKSIKDANKSKSTEWKNLTSNADLNAALENADFLAAAENTDMAKILKENGRWFANQAFQSLLANEDFGKLVASEDYRNLVASPEYKNLTASADFRQIAANEDFQKIAKQDLAAAIAASEDMGKTTTKDMGKTTSSEK